VNRRPTAWIASEIYYPEETSTGYLLTRLAEGLALHGDVAVLCAQPSYERRGMRVPGHETRNGVAIHRVGHPRFPRASVSGRIANMAVVTLGMFFSALRRLRRGDIVIVVTNPPLLPFAISLAAFLRGARVALLLHDLYPEAAILAGVVGPRSPIARLWRAATTALLRRVDRVIALGRDAADLLSPRTGDPRKVVIIPNWADVDDVRPADPAENEMLRQLGLQDRFVLGYAGNMGRVHDVEMLARVSELLRTRVPRAHLLVVGSGAKAGLLEHRASGAAPNVTLAGPRPRDDQQVFLNACHVAIMALIPGMAGVGVPSRLYNVMAAGKPMIAAIDPHSEPALVLREERIGVCTRPGDEEDFVRAVELYERDTRRRKEEGERARAAAERDFRFGHIVERYRQMLTELGWRP
jgi:glycosyltransferase involved in cell wall biosynthesis